MNNSSDISIVIPTRNRLHSLHRSLNSISTQTCSPREIIIVDSSDFPLNLGQLDIHSKTLDVQIYHTNPSVCYQRNFGIEKSISKFILLLDDDIELSENYIESLLFLLENNPNETICSGLILEEKNGQWTYCEEQKSNLGLLLSYIFGLSVGLDLRARTWPKSYLFQSIQKTFMRNGNSISKAGWPIVIDFSEPDFTTPIYGLGASIIRAEKLKEVNYDTAFYENGIGDNYDLIMSLQSNVRIVTNAKAFHYRETSNRLSPERSYYYRIAALHYIQCKHSKFTVVNLGYLIWSLIGNSIYFIAKGKIKMLGYNLEVITRIIFNFPLYKSKK